MGEHDMTFGFNQGASFSAGILTLYGVNTEPGDLVVDLLQLDGGASDNHANVGPGQIDDGHRRHNRPSRSAW
jgi:hypothetical protein